ncbi:MAG: winged helix-turn-helix domain-containing protein [Terriglobales bacterium]
MLPQEGNSQGKRIRFDDFELDCARFQLLRKGKPLRLEGLPLQLLMFLVENKGQLVTREQISAALWSKDVFVDVDQGINTAIRKIRRALGDDAGEPLYLQTVVGRGYRFVAPIVEDDAASQGAQSQSAQRSAQAASPDFMVTPEELGRAIMTAAGLDPDDPKASPPKPSEES